MKKPTKIRVDQLLFDKKLYPSRERAQAAVLAGEVWMGNQRLEKPGHQINSDAEFFLKPSSQKYVSRGGYKIEFAIDHFNIDIKDRVALDVGASTGGFTDCLLQRGARLVFSVDVGHGQLDAKIRNNLRVVPLEKVNARALRVNDLSTINPQAQQITLIVIDVSFISLTKIIPNLAAEFLSLKDWIVLFKPQFEVGRSHIRKGGIVDSIGTIQKALDSFQIFLNSIGFKRIGFPVLSPIEGKKSGNQEYLFYFSN